MATPAQAAALVGLAPVAAPVQPVVVLALLALLAAPAVLTPVKPLAVVGKTRKRRRSRCKTCCPVTGTARRVGTTSLRGTPRVGCVGKNARVTASPGDGLEWGGAGVGEEMLYVPLPFCMQHNNHAMVLRLFRGLCLRPCVCVVYIKEPPVPVFKSSFTFMPFSLLWVSLRRLARCGCKWSQPGGCREQKK